MTAQAWLPAPQSTDASARLFCFPYAGGGAGIYRSWPREFAPHVQVVPVQLPGRESRLTERAFRSMDALMPPLLDALRTYLDRPFACFGHSMGALIAFELARALRRERLTQPSHLFLAGHRAPQLPADHAPIYLLPRDEFHQALRALQGTPEEVLENEELMNLMEPTLRADFQLAETYTPKREEPLDLPMILFGGTDDPSLSEDDLAAWGEHTRAGTRVQMLPGHHFLPPQPVIGEVLRALLAARLS